MLERQANPYAEGSCLIGFGDTNVVQIGRAIHWIREHHPEVGVLVLSQHIHAAGVVDLVSQRAFGYLLKDRVADVTEFADAVRHFETATAMVMIDIAIMMITMPFTNQPIWFHISISDRSISPSPVQSVGWLPDNRHLHELAHIPVALLRRAEAEIRRCTTRLLAERRMLRPDDPDRARLDPSLCVDHELHDDGSASGKDVAEQLTAFGMNVSPRPVTFTQILRRGT